MAQFALTCIDKPGALELRLQTRPDHVAYLNASDSLRLAGPFLDADGNPCGSLLVIEAADLSAAQAFAAQDPYAKAGLFQSVDIRPFTRTLGSWS